MTIHVSYFMNLHRKVAVCMCTAYTITKIYIIVLFLQQNYIYEWRRKLLRKDEQSDEENLRKKFIIKKYYNYVV